MRLSNDKYLIVTGRFQPLHFGHLDLFRNVITEFGLHLIICILRKEEKKNIDLNELGASEFEKMCYAVQSEANNPLPNWQRLELLNTAIRNDKFLKDRVTIMLRDRPDTDWEKSIQDLPENRIWIFNTSNSKFDRAKVEFYRDKQEETITVNYPSLINGTDIRKELRKKPTTFNFLPIECQAFFEKNCFHFFRQIQT